MSKSTDNDKLLALCRVCLKHLSLNSQCQGANCNVFKTTSCCKGHSLLYIKCARVFSTVIDPSFNFDSSNYTADKNIKLDCFVCENNCCYYNKKHILNPNDKSRSVNVCRKCKKPRYYLYSKYNTDSINSVCADCIEKDKSDVPIDTYKPPLSLSPITTQCDKDKVLTIHSIVPSLLELAVHEATTFDQCDKFTKLYVTHLHPDKRNIFSPNAMTFEPIDGIFLSPNLLYKLLESESQERVTEELYNFFADVLNFHAEFIPSK